MANNPGLLVDQLSKDPVDSVPFLTRNQIKTSIALGQVLVLHRSYVYKLNAWLNKHPGGELAILHFVGRDATDEIEAYHPEKVIKQMRPFIVGKVVPEEWEDKKAGVGWKPLNPPIQIGLWPMPCTDEIHPEPLRKKPEPILRKSDHLAILDHTLDHNSRSIPDSSKNFRTIDHVTSSTRLDEVLSALEPAPDPPQEAFQEGYDLSPARQKHLSNSYRVLHDKIRAAGLYRAPQPFYGYGPDLLRYSVLFLAFFLTHPAFPLLKRYLASFLLDPTDVPFVETPSTLRCFVSAVFLGLWWHQITFVAHDAGHSGITGDWLKDRLIGILIGNFLGGISIGWWCDNHDVHHLVTNHPEHDPDIQHLPFFAISTKFFKSLRSTYYKHTMRFNRFAKFSVKHQHQFYYFIMLFARFNLLFNSCLYLATRKKQKMRNLEIAGIIFFWVYFGFILSLLPGIPTRIMFLLVSFAVTSPLHVQIVLSHFAQSTADLGLNECFAHRQIRTTMDVSCPPWLDFLHGGLHMQVTHHLFPRLPRHRLRLASERFVQPWCRQEGLTYSSMGFVQGNSKVLGTLQEVGKQLKILGTVASAQAHGLKH
ncbi:uncharacterized protein PGTG_07693 [Puccinia graminis f. sp. tritici CRL 75-36-700-3]|uniref:Delta 8-(E)-sphingolipid desaturase n=1 Tax=Puccinia graminis f. sp. tritici (strain CRL 75-36-700-3 / race SCCL) TaxID=418459 RepID=E3KD58_PUCGT|nr:uncharacterized protein PGTG_07693 [Puccinia graminis f. sp. tritici CRL 75-36-700-3]EFP82296.2 hypothetical protein PGTG_07693 [Puccinia graminis f. sp. tritici CRL 75-36-700-3]